MDIHLPDYIVAELEMSALKARKTRLRVRDGETIVDVLSMDDSGFTLPIDAPRLRGAVAVLDGARHISDCLIVAAECEGRFMRYEYKRCTPITDNAPVDYVREDDSPVALLG
ncbi:hypothetical protein SAMN06273572_101386 [Monaibacterium marinum]|uniref:Uncharacterized protein n=1 Tax=Pontivivens marinum TaxID=1690039 RepID=A0A2C9CQ92_9RHOB|nr:hypothetical protein [Monaibacterium marinum]SOH92539.1 hypothetical protein SAMN06273572_101386 [Monaibacterium marinum]